MKYKIPFVYFVFIFLNVTAVLALAINYQAITRVARELLYEYQSVSQGHELDLISKSVRQYAVIGDYVGVKRVIQNALKNPTIKMIRFKSKDNAEELCVDKTNDCYNHSEKTIFKSIYFDSTRVEAFADIEVSFENLVENLLQRISFVILLGLGAILIVFNMVIYLMSQTVRKHLQDNISMVRILTEGGEIKAMRSSIFIERSAFQNSIHKLKNLLADYRSQISKAAENESFLHIAQQVAHDIKSPLAALEVLQRDLGELPEEKRILLRSAVKRMADIANDLSSRKNRTEAALRAGGLELTGINTDLESSGLADERDVHLIPALLESLVSEKRLQHRARMNVEIESDLGADSYGLFARVELREFKRVLSNLVNNAVEALGEEGGSVRVSLTGQRGEFISLSLSDTGRGIVPEILPKLMQRGETHGKKGGSGLGLYHAKTTMRSWGGDVQIASEPGKGTTVTITLPREPSPGWFVPELKIQRGGTVVIVDDDDSIHQIWRHRLGKIAKEYGITLKHFSTPGELGIASCQSPVAGRSESVHQASTRFGQADINLSDEMLKSDKATSDQRQAIGDLILSDYEFLGSKDTGLDMIEKLGLGSRAFLVTSHYEEPDVRARCKRLGVQLLPKNLAGFVPVTCTGAGLTLPHPTNVTRDNIFPSPSPTVREGEGNAGSSCVPGGERVGYDAILIDDDALVHMNWKIAAKKQNKILRTCTGPEEFQNIMTDVDKSTPIYVDCDLGKNIRGEDVTKQLSQSGFTRLYLATGYDKSGFPHMPWISDIVDKMPPWIT